MPSGAAVIRYEGSRKGVVWRVKYRDATGRQVQETLGPEREGWTRKKAEAELRKRLVDVERSGLTRPGKASFEEFARQWLQTYPVVKNLKRSTIEGYTSIINTRLIPAFRRRKVGDLSVDEIEQYVAKRTKAGDKARTINRDLNLLSNVLNAAVRKRLLASNPVGLVVRPRAEDVEWTILTPPQVAAVAEAFSSLARGARGEAQLWLVQARVIFLVVTTLGLRRGEVRGLHWRSVDLADPEGAVVRVAETFVRGAADTPKSRAGRRTIPLGPVVAEELWQHWRRTAFKGLDEYVFCSPSRGTPFDVGRYAESLTKALSLAGVEARVRPFHDGRHTSITNDAAAGSTPMGMMKRAGHANFATTQGYINLAGVSFRGEALEAEARLLRGLSVQESGTNLDREADSVGESES